MWSESNRKIDLEIVYLSMKDKCNWVEACKMYKNSPMLLLLCFNFLLALQRDW